MIRYSPLKPEAFDEPTVIYTEDCTATPQRRQTPCCAHETTCRSCEDNNPKGPDSELMRASIAYMDRLIINDLSGLARTFASRERVILAMDKPIDRYDLDLEPAWREPLRMLPGIPIKSLGALNLYREMELTPVSTSMLHGQDMHARGAIFEAPDDRTSTDKWTNKLGIWLDDLPLQQKLIVMMKIGIPVHVRFSKEDRLDWNPWIVDENYPLFRTSGDYEIDFELMYPVWPLIKRDGVVEDSDPQPIKVATVFLV